jgi:hypothetical protein
MSRHSEGRETRTIPTDFVVELRGFEPMAIAGVGIRQSREFMRVLTPVYTRENPARRSGDTSFSTTETIASRVMYCRPERPCT